MFTYTTSPRTSVTHARVVDDRTLCSRLIRADWTHDEHATVEAVTCTWCKNSITRRRRNFGQDVHYTQMGSLA